MILLAQTLTSLEGERANLSFFCTFLQFVHVWICRFPLPLGVWEGLWFVIVALPGLFSYLFCTFLSSHRKSPLGVKKIAVFLLTC